MANDPAKNATFVHAKHKHVEKNRTFKTVKKLKKCTQKGMPCHKLAEKLDRLMCQASGCAKKKIAKRHRPAESKTLTVESDWSSASYWYSIVALSDVGTEITLSAYKQNALQGDAVLADIYKVFGVITVFKNNSIILQKIAIKNIETTVDLDLANAPDIAQTIAVTAFGLGMGCYMKGLHTLKIKETDRLVALKTELEKLGAQVVITEATLQLAQTRVILSNINIETYNDHRMAMAFAPLALKTAISIKDANVVSKSYPQFWEDLASVGFIIK